MESQVIPFDTGNMQNDSMFVDDSKLNRGIVLIRVDTIYSRRMYFHPEYNFKKDKNSNAQGMWFEPWISGTKKMYLSITFARFLRKEYEKHESQGN